MNNEELNSDNQAFIAFCHWLYDENCHERLEHGQKPYKHFQVYYTTHLKWLKKTYKERDESTQ